MKIPDFKCTTFVAETRAGRPNNTRLAASDVLEPSIKNTSNVTYSYVTYDVAVNVTCHNYESLAMSIY